MWLIICLLLLSINVSAQTIGPAEIRPSLPVAQQAAIDALYCPDPLFFLGWNWGACLRQTNVDLQTNFLHTANPFRWTQDPLQWARPQFVLQNVPPATMLALAPTDEIPGVTATNYGWFFEARDLDVLDQLDGRRTSPPTPCAQ